jgi:hypothetical protein
MLLERESLRGREAGRVEERTSGDGKSERDNARRRWVHGFGLRGCGRGLAKGLARKHQWKMASAVTRPIVFSEIHFQ